MLEPYLEQSRPGCREAGFDGVEDNIKALVEWGEGAFYGIE